MKVRMLLAGIVVGAVVTGGVAFGIDAAASGSSTTYQACLSTKGALSKVGTSTPSCKSGQSVITWNSVGPQGPAGPQGSSACSGVPHDDADFAGCDFQGAYLENADFTGSDLSAVNLSNANIAYADVQGANFSGADLTGISSTPPDSAGSLLGTPAALPAGWQVTAGLMIGPGANLTGVNFPENTDLTDADLAGAQLSGSTTNGSTFNGANLSGANLTRTQWSGTQAFGTNFSDANLSFASLAGAVLTGSNFVGATWQDTICPDDTNSNQDGGTCVNNLL